MHGLLGGIPADAALLAAEADPTQQPVRTSAYFFAFLALCLALLVVSMLRHLRRVDRNLGPAKGALDDDGEGGAEPRPAPGLGRDEP